MIKSNWEWWTLADSTSVSLGKSNISLFSPCSAPWIFNSPSLIAGSNHEYCVVNVGNTVIENTWCICFPVGGINSDGHRILLDLIFDLWTSSEFSISVSFILSSFSLTLLISGNIWISTLSSLSEIFNIL